VIKVCGLKDPAQAVHCARAGVDLIGLVFASKSKRLVTAEAAAAIGDTVRAGRRCSDADVAAQLEAAARLPTPAARWRALGECAFRHGPLIAGVFADQDPAEVNALAAAARLDIIQLSGAEPLEDATAYCRPVIKALHVDAAHPPNPDSVPGAAWLLLDTFDPSGARGGTGETFDWSATAALSGGTDDSGGRFEWRPGVDFFFFFFLFNLHF
jgi:anthranilate synthase/indole-3-glycerol phosphate synthase/phosphoribosylanthranilate isomerase